MVWLGFFCYEKELKRYSHQLQTYIVIRNQQRIELQVAQKHFLPMFSQHRVYFKNRVMQWDFTSEDGRNGKAHYTVAEIKKDLL